MPVGRSMSLETIQSMLEAAARGRYALGCFSAWSLEAMHGAIEAAEQAQSPVVFALDGSFGDLGDSRLTDSPGRVQSIVDVARLSRVPCALVLNAPAGQTWTKPELFDAFNVFRPFPEADEANVYTERVRQIAIETHTRGAAVAA